MSLLSIFLPWVKIKQLEEELEKEQMRLAGCGIAAMANTRNSIRTRIDRNNPYWSASYGDVCSAVDREILYRELLEKECGDIDRVISRLGLSPEEYRTEGGCLKVPKLLNAIADMKEVTAG